MNDGDIVRAMEMMTGVQGGHGIASQYPKTTDGQAPHSNNHSWPPYSTERRATIIFNTDIEVIQDPNHEKRIRFGL